MRHEMKASSGSRFTGVGFITSGQVPRKLKFQNNNFQQNMALGLNVHI